MFGAVNAHARHAKVFNFSKRSQRRRQRLLFYIFIPFMYTGKIVFIIIILRFSCKILNLLLDFGKSLQKMVKINHFMCICIACVRFQSVHVTAPNYYNYFGYVQCACCFTSAQKHNSRWSSSFNCVKNARLFRVNSFCADASL